MPLPASMVVRDAVAVAIAGVTVALIANAISPRGLSLRRDYFLTAPHSAGTLPAVEARGGRRPESRLAQRAPTAPPAAPTTKRGLPLASYDEAARLFHDPRFAAGRIMFVDARSEERYAAGHIPGAYGFDHYRPGPGVAALLAAAQAADRIVVYCHGGDCEDSELAAFDLIALGVPAAKLVIFAGGFSEWQQRGMPSQRQAP